MQLKRYIAMFVAICVTTVAMIPIETFAHSPYDSAVSGNSAEILTSGVDWLNAELFRDEDSFTLNTQNEVKLLFTNINTKSFMIRSAQHRDLDPLLGFEVSYDGKTFEKTEMQIKEVGTYTHSGLNWPLKELEYTSGELDSAVKAIRLTRAQCYNMWYFDIVDLQYLDIPYTYNTSVSAKSAVVETSGVSWVEATLFNNEKSYALT
ncbi:MAG: hypothetical protein IKK24_03505, partial [Clostridia bacterium]|nr:hypothetical protein [Clostridia bacterium]